MNGYEYDFNFKEIRTCVRLVAIYKLSEALDPFSLSESELMELNKVSEITSNIKM